MPSADVDMVDASAELEPRPAAGPSSITQPALPQPQETSDLTSSSNTHKASSENNGGRLQCSVSPILRQRNSELPQGFSKIDWTREGMIGEFFHTSEYISYTLDIQ